MVASHGAGVIAVGSAGDRPLVESLLRHAADVPILDLCGRTSLLELAALAAEVDLVISNDTGPLHLAAAAGGRRGGHLYVHGPAVDRSVRSARDDGSNGDLVQVQLDQDVQSDGVYAGTDAGSSVVGG